VRDVEGIARDIWRRTLSLSDAMHLERRGKSGDDFIPPPGQLDPITALVLANDDATLDAAVKRAQGADKPRAFLLSMTDADGRLSIRAPSHASQPGGGTPDARASTPEDAARWWRYTESVRIPVEGFVEVGRCAPVLDDVLALVGRLAVSCGATMPPDEMIRPVVAAWLASRVAS